MLVAEAWRLCWYDSILVVAYSGWIDPSLRWLVTRKRRNFFPSLMDLEGLKDFRNFARCVPEQAFGHLPLKSGSQKKGPVLQRGLEGIPEP